MIGCRPLLGTYVTIRVEGAGAVAKARAVDAAFDAVARVHRAMSFFEASSDVMRINHAQPGDTLQIDPWTVEVIRIARRISWRSSGLFDCGATALATSLRGGARVRLSKPARLDLGGIAKGYAVDRAVAVLARHGMRAGVVNAGGDLRVFGDAQEPVFVRDPDAPAQTRLAGLLKDGAVATSGAYFGTHNRIVDPASGQARRSRGSHSVVAAHCVIADALTKVVALSGDPGHPCLAAMHASAWCTVGNQHEAGTAEKKPHRGGA